MATKKQTAKQTAATKKVADAKAAKAKAAADKKQAVIDAKADAKADKPQPKLVERDCFGNKTTSSASRINAFFIGSPNDVQQARFISETLEAGGLKCSLSRTRTHIQWLRNHGFVEKSGDGYAVTANGRKVVRLAVKVVKPRARKSSAAVA